MTDERKAAIRRDAQAYARGMSPEDWAEMSDVEFWNAIQTRAESDRSHIVPPDPQEVRAVTDPIYDKYAH